MLLFSNQNSVIDKRLKVCIVALLSILIVACKSTPSWLNAANLDTQQDFISVGSGNTLEAATQRAIQNLSNRLIVKVESKTTTISSKQTNGQVNQQFNSVGNSQSEVFNFIDIKVAESYFDKGLYYAKVKVQKNAFFRQIKSQLDSQIPTGILAKEQIIIQGIKLWPKRQQVQSYITLLQQYQTEGAIYQGRMKLFIQEFEEAMATTNVELIMSNASEITSLGIEARLQKALALSTKFTATSDSSSPQPDNLTLIITGPTLSEYQQGQLHAVQLKGQSVVLFNNNLTSQKPISVIEVGRNLAKTKTNAIDKFVEQLFVF